MIAILLLTVFNRTCANGCEPDDFSLANPTNYQTLK
jgi:hypothetical protein